MQELDRNNKFIRHASGQRIRNQVEERARNPVLPRRFAGAISTISRRRSTNDQPFRSHAMLPQFFARRYLFSPKSRSVVNLISGLSVAAGCDARCGDDRPALGLRRLREPRQVHAFGLRRRSDRLGPAGADLCGRRGRYRGAETHSGRGRHVVRAGGERPAGTR